MQKIQLSIPEPCHQDWNNMIANEQGKYCNACAKTVVDFSLMSDSALINYFTDLKNQQVCGRVYPDQLDRVIQLPARPGNKFWMYWQYVFALFLFIGKGSAAKAQGKIQTEINQVVTPDTLKPFEAVVGGIGTTKVPRRLATIALQVVNEEGEVIPFASAQLSPGGDGVIADSAGWLKLKTNRAVGSIKVSAVGYKERTVKINEFANSQIELKLNTQPMGEIVMVAHNRSMGNMRLGGISTKCSNSFADTLKKLTTLVPTGIHVAPNPVAAGDLLTLQFKLTDIGPYNVKITNNSGQLLLVKQFYSPSKQVNQQVPISTKWPAGIYFITVFNSKGNKIGTDQIVIK